MNTRRVRDGRQVRERRLRRATLQSARNLALARLGLMLESINRFELMLDQLRKMQPPAAVETCRVIWPAGCWSEGQEAYTEPDTREAGATGMVVME